MLEFISVTKRFGERLAVDAVTFHVDRPMMDRRDRTLGRRQVDAFCAC